MSRNVKHHAVLLSSIFAGRPYVCPSCFKQASRSAARSSRSSTRESRQVTRRASSIASSTAINATKDIPSQLVDIHRALEQLRIDAPNHVDFSKLRLALQGLESKRPVIRIAILGLQSPDSARRLAGLLLADPLEPPQEWENQLFSSNIDDGRSLLIRYGNTSDIISSSPILRTIHVPSLLLRRRNLELLISSVPDPSSATTTNSNMDNLALVPMVGTPMNSTGSMSFVRYPVYRALVLGDGIQGCMALAPWSRHAQTSATTATDRVKLLLNIPTTAEQRASNEELSVELVDIEEASAALQILRGSTENSAAYGRRWLQSGIGRVKDWIGEDLGNEAEQELAPVVHDLAHDVVEEAAQSVHKDRANRMVASPALSGGTKQLRALDEALTQWATVSHTELQEQLELAFAARDWRKLRWWKLFWRVDDVTMILTQLIERRWLVEAEKGELWLSGRATEAGLPYGGQDETKVPAERESTRSVDALFSAGQVELQRNALRIATIPPLQALAQHSVLKAIFSSSIAAGISALVYVAWPAWGIYGAGSIAALGTVWSLRRLQSTWEAAIAFWQGELREQGRVALKQTQDRMSTLVAQGPVQQRDQLDTLQDVELAEAAVEDARQALAQFVGPRKRSDG